MNPYVKKVSEKLITYYDEFKRLLVIQLDKRKTPRMFFEESGLDIISTSTFLFLTMLFSQPTKPVRINRTLVGIPAY